MPKLEFQEHYSEKSTTLKWCNSNKKSVVEERLLSIAQHNANVFKNLIEYVSFLSPNKRMLRLPSGVLPLATHPDWSYLWEDQNNTDVIFRILGEAGEIARKKDVRLSFHPGQFTVISSDNNFVVESSIKELEYHTRIATAMGFCQKNQDIKINIHVSGKGGISAAFRTLKKLSHGCRRALTFENCEFSTGIDELLGISRVVPIVIDLHHHWIRTGEYLKPDDDRTKAIFDTWHQFGKRPVIHYSYSKEDLLDSHDKLHDLDYLIESGIPKQKLRAHSDNYPNEKANDWALSFLEHADIHCEAKEKSLAQDVLYNRAVETGLIPSEKERDHGRFLLNLSHRGDFSIKNDIVDYVFSFIEFYTPGDLLSDEKMHFLIFSKSVVFDFESINHLTIYVHPYSERPYSITMSIGSEVYHDYRKLNL